MELSKRLTAVAGLVTEGASVADIGTDHGYIPIHLIEQNLSPKVIAMDINKGPLERARIHIAGYGMSDRIETRLSDGLAAVKPKEVEEMIVAGMGGGLVIHILEEGKQIVSTLKGCILQPQSEIQKVREYLVEHMMRVVPPEYCEHKTADRQEDCKKEEWEYLYGPLLLKNKNPILYEYLKREIRIREDILLGLAGKDGERIKERMTEIEHELEVAKKAMSYYEE